MKVIKIENEGRLNITIAASKGYIVDMQVCKELRVIK